MDSNAHLRINLKNATFIHNFHHGDMGEKYTKMMGHICFWENLLPITIRQN